MMDTNKIPKACTLAIALGANLPSQVGPPEATLIAARPLIENEITEWLGFLQKRNTTQELISSNLTLRWSPLFETKAIGGPPNQPDYINAVVLVNGPIFTFIKPSETAALNLLKRLISIEIFFGRSRKSPGIKWGPRCLDIDLLVWGELQVQHRDLILPHPRIIERNFVITPLSEALNLDNQKPKRLPPQSNWPE